MKRLLLLLLLLLGCAPQGAYVHAVGSVRAVDTSDDGNDRHQHDHTHDHTR